MALEVGEADEDVGIHDGPANPGGLAVLAVDDGDLHVVGTPQAVADDNLTAGGDGVEAVEVGAVQVLEGVLPAAGVEGVAVGQEGETAPLLAQLGHRPGVVGTEEGQVAQLAEVHFDGDKLAVHVDVLDSGCDAEAL